MRKMMKRIAAATIGMAIVMTSTACSSGTGSTTAAPENKETMPRQKPIHIRHVSRNGLMRWRRKQTAVL